MTNTAVTMPADVKKLLFHILNMLPLEVDNLKKALINNTFDGSMYSTKTGGCLAGTMCSLHGKELQERWNNHQETPTWRTSGLVVITRVGSFLVHNRSPLELYVRHITPWNTDPEQQAKRWEVLAAITEWDLKHRTKAVKKWKAARKKPLVINGPKPIPAAWTPPF